jgi:NADH-ubiquinone oxidoreductase chain 5
LAFFEVGLNKSSVIINLGSWLNSEYLSINWEFLFDGLSCAMLIPVLYISFLIHIFSIDYMANDPHSQRFFSYLSLFTFFMVLLVTGGNYFLMFIGQKYKSRPNSRVIQRNSHHCLLENPKALSTIF